ncbi:hypothetical protein [Polaromonas sp. JS666]|uniref:hypothetical protein n=1 Tax=Polaromonas sp. (strain JS666 / ATCC BAA-500) TaxID=296591 RepID=UPI0000531DDD|nr:hypothetical protein [Polaromonas sp. JS666]
MTTTYYRCSGCGFKFTRAFDHWTPSDFAPQIYNGERGTRTAQDVSRQFGIHAERLSVLDWGSGEGSFAADLQRHGFSRVDSGAGRNSK